MTYFRRALCALVTLTAWALPAGAARAAGTTTTTAFTSPGSYTFIVPTGVSSVTVTAIGGSGGGCAASLASGGEGASLTATFAVSPGEQLSVGVGANGDACRFFGGAPAATGGGGAGGVAYDGGAAGGGASLVGPSPSASFSLLVAAGGGGAGGAANSGEMGGRGGDAGAAGANSVGGDGAGGAGSSSEGGTGGGPASVSGGNPGANGSQWLGGAGGGASVTASTGGGGGGGGGYYGGGGGASGDLGGGGGGGGSSFVSPDATGVSDPKPTGNPPEVTITYAVPTAEESPSSLPFATQPQGTAGPEQDLSLTNNGSAPLIVSGVVLGGADPGDFLIDDRCQQPVAAGSSCQVGVRFSPQAPGSRAATLTLLTNAPSAPAAVTLSGTGGQLPQGPPGPPGSQGPLGATGPQGSPGQVELVTCKTVTRTVKRHHHRVHVTQQRCTTKLVSGTVKFTTTGATIHATISRAGAVYATGVQLAAGHGSSRLVLSPRHALRRGRFTLTLRLRRGHRWITERRQIMIR